MKKFNARPLAATAAAVALFSSNAWAAWPDDKPIELVVGFSAGGETDILARTLAPFLQKHIGGKANLVVVNKPGASGAIANTFVQRAEKDGYTVAFVNTPPMNFLPLYQNTHYDPDRFALIGRVVSDPTLLVVPDSSPYTSLKQLVQDLKDKPESVSVGQNGLGSNGNVAMNLLMVETGARFNDVPFPGTGPSKVALLGGHVDMIFASHTAVPAPEKEPVKLRILSQFMAERASILPDVPTATEEGFPVVVPSDRGIAVDKSVPQDVQDRLQAALKAAVNDPEFRRAAKSFEAILAYKSGPEWQADIVGAKASLQALAAELKAREKTSGQ